MKEYLLTLRFRNMTDEIWKSIFIDSFNKDSFSKITMNRSKPFEVLITEISIPHHPENSIAQRPPEIESEEEYTQYIESLRQALLLGGWSLSFAQVQYFDSIQKAVKEKGLDFSLRDFDKLGNHTMKKYMPEIKEETE